MVKVNRKFFLKLLMIVFVFSGMSSCKNSINDVKKDTTGGSTENQDLQPKVKAQISQVLMPGSRTYGVGESLIFSVTFDKIVWVSGQPRLTLNIGGQTRYAVYMAGGGSKVISFKFIVENGLTDTDGIEFLNFSLDLNQGQIICDDKLNAGLDFNYSAGNIVIIDSSSPSIISFARPLNGYYKEGQELLFSVTYSENVNISGLPRLSINMGGNVKQAIYQGGSGTALLSFKYTIEAGIEDFDGLQIVDGAVSLGGGSIVGVDSSKNALLILPNPDLSQVFVDSLSPQILSMVGPSDKTYDFNEKIEFVVNFSEKVYVVGNPRIGILIGANQKYANYVSGSASNQLLFRYTVESGDSDLDGISFISGQIDLLSSQLVDIVGNTASLILPSASLANVKVQALPPQIVGVTLAEGKFYRQGEAIGFDVEFSKSVNVTGYPYIELNIGGQTKRAKYLSGSGNSIITFSYTVESGLLDENGISFLGTSLILDGGQIKSLTAQNSGLEFGTLDATAIKVDSLMPAIVQLSGLSDGSYSFNDEMVVNVEFSENVQVTGVPNFYMDIGGVTKLVNYIGGSGSTILQFRYTVELDLIDQDGVTLLGPIALDQSNKIVDQAGNIINPLFSNVQLSNILINSQMPVVLSVTTPLSGWNKQNSYLDFSVLFNRTVNVVGSNYLEINIGGAIKQAQYVSGSGTTTLNFRYTVEDNLQDTDGIEFAQGLIVLSGGGTIKGDSGLDAMIEFSPVAMAGVLVDCLEPEEIEFSLQNRSFILPGEKVSIKLKFNENVTSSGQPKLNLNLWGSNSAGTTHLQNQAVSLDVQSVTGQDVLFEYVVPASYRHVYRVDFSSLDFALGSLVDEAGNAAVTSGLKMRKANFISLGEFHSCLINASKKLYCWGKNLNGQLGIDSTVNANTPQPVDAANDYQFVSTGQSHTCAITTGNLLKCWGLNLSGRLGNGSKTQQNFPVNVDAATAYAWVAAGAQHTCGINVFGQLKCWGENGSGQLGINSTVDNSSPQLVSSGTVYYKKVVSGSMHSCAIKNDNKLFCWGENASRQVGNNSTTDRRVPTAIDNVNNYLDIAMGSVSLHSCGLTDFGQINCWGESGNYQTGQGAITDLGLPAVVDSGVYYSSLSSGANYTCGITLNESALKCWGQNASGQFGRNNTTNATVPELIDDTQKYFSHIGGTSHACSYFSNGKLSCSGLNSSGQLGIGSTVNKTVFTDVSLDW